MSSEEKKSVVLFDSKEKLIDLASFVSSAAPIIGGAVSNVLSGISTDRKIKRVDLLLRELAEELRGFQSEVSNDYVKTEDFEDLLEQTLRRTSEERNEQKRQILKAFLLESVKSPGESYDDQLRFLKLSENIYGDHILVLKALLETPKEIRGGLSGSPFQTLKDRLPDLSEEKIKDLVNQLNDLRLVHLPSLNVMTTANGAQDLRNHVTQLGLRYVSYLNS